MTQIKIVEVGSEVNRAEDHINTALKKLQDKGYFIQDIKYHETKFSQYCTIMYDDNTYSSRSGDVCESDEEFSARMKREAENSGGDFLGACKSAEAKRED